jgi:hypothetical protein
MDQDKGIVDGIAAHFWDDLHKPRRISVVCKKGNHKGAKKSSNGQGKNTQQ